MALTWNIVNKTGEAFDAVRGKLRPKISKLESLLSDFPQDAVHLQVILAARPKDKSYTVTLNLRVPSDVLHVKKRAKSLTTAFDDATDVLVRRLKRLKARYRRDYAWKSRRQRRTLERAVQFAEEPLAIGTKPQTLEDIVIEVLREDYKRLLGFVHRQINEYVLSRAIPDSALDPRDIVDKVAEEALSQPERKPASMDYRTWCSSLAFRETRKAVRSYLEEMDLVIPENLDISPKREHCDDDDVDPEEYAVNLLQAESGPGDIPAAERIPGPQTEQPDVRFEGLDMIGMLRRMARRWPKLEREVFEMHFLEGFSTDDIAVTFGCDREAVLQYVARVRARLRTQLSDMTDETEALKTTDEQESEFAEHLTRAAAKKR